MEELERLLAEFKREIEDKYKTLLQWRTALRLCPSHRNNPSAERACSWSRDRLNYSGVYAYVDKGDQPLYVRQAKNLMDEISQHIDVEFQSKIVWIRNERMRDVHTVAVLPLRGEIFDDVAESLEWFFVTRLHPPLNEFVPTGWMIR